MAAKLERHRSVQQQAAWWLGLCTARSFSCIKLTPACRWACGLPSVAAVSPSLEGAEARKAPHATCSGVELLVAARTEQAWRQAVQA
eukprot:4371659-Prymnesium_polylepis.1